MTRILPLLLMLVLTALSPVHGAQEEDLLDADVAFALSTRTLDPNTLEASWKIAPGYYLYRNKFRFELLDGNAVLKPALLPPGKQKEDPQFGKVETYSKAVTARIPLERKDANAQTLRVRIVAQGCNEPIGVCYPPITKEVRFTLAALPVATAAPDDSTRGTLKNLVRTTASDGTEPPDPEQAFVLRVEPVGTGAVKVNFDIDDCCYLYRDKLKFNLVAAEGEKLPEGVTLDAVNLPKGKSKNDEFLGKTEVYDKPFEVTIPITGLTRAGDNVLLEVGYQGCSEKGVAICYPPTTKRIPLAGATVNAMTAPVMTTGEGATAKTSNGKFAAYVLGAFGIGLLLTFTPCVLPMIPILSSVLVGSVTDRQLTKLEGGLMSGAYVLGTATTYTIAGIIAGATGEQLQAYFQNAWALGIFAAIFGLLALSMFGFYELQMPSFIQSHLHHHSHHAHSRLRHVKGGVFVGLYFMGLLSALIVGACVSPLVISALGVAIANRDPVLGGAIMFAMALGMGMILIAIGVGAGFLLPKAGVWMDRVKHVFGVLLIGVAIYLLGLIPQFPVLLAWAGLLIIVGVYLGATQSLPHGATGWQYLWKGLGTLSLIWGVAALLGGFAGHRNILSPLPAGIPGMTGATIPAEATPLFERVTTLRDLESGLARAKAASKPVILDYYADWCTDCLRMENTTFRDASVRAALAGRFVLLQADVTDTNNRETKALKGKFGVFGPPAMLFLGADGAERRELRIYGYRNADDFMTLLRGL